MEGKIERWNLKTKSGKDKGIGKVQMPKSKAEKCLDDC